MVNNDVILAKVSNIKKCLQRIKDKTNLDPSSLENIDIQDLFVLQLQRAIQAAIKIASHIVSDKNLGLASSSAENFELLATHNGLDKDLSKNLVKMVGFRNVAVHDYDNVDISILGSILTKHLKDLEDFCHYAMNRS